MSKDETSTEPRSRLYELFREKLGGDSNTTFKTVAPGILVYPVFYRHKEQGKVKAVEGVETVHLSLHTAPNGDAYFAGRSQTTNQIFYWEDEY